MCSKISEDLPLSTNNYVPSPSQALDQDISHYFFDPIYRPDMVD